MSQVVNTQREVLDQKFAVATPTSPNPPTVVIPATNLVRFNIKTFHLKNVGPNALVMCKIQATYIETQGQDPKEPTRWLPSTTDADWEDVDAAAFAALGVGVYKSFTVLNDARKWWRIIAQVAAGSAALSPAITAG